MKKYKIDFGVAFIACLLIMIFYEGWKVLDTLPEIFQSGDIVYHFIAGVISIINQLAIGIASAIIFYYFVEFLDKKKNYEIYTNVRRDILFLCYSHLHLLTKIETFKVINNRDRRVADFYDCYDIPLLVNLFENNSTAGQIEKIKNEIIEFFKTQSKKQIGEFTDSFKRDIELLKNKVNYRYFKESKDLIESIYLWYDDDFEMISQIYIFDEDEKNRSAYIETMADDYYRFLESTIVFYVELEKFIVSIEKKDIWTFIQMLE